MSCITIFILFGTNIFITIEVILRFFTVFTRSQYVSIFSNPNGRNSLLRNWTIDMSCITIFILFCTDIFIAIEVTFRLFTIFTRTKNSTVFSHPNSCDILLRNWFINVMDITIIVFNCTNIFVSIEVVFRLFTIFPWSQYMTINRFPDCFNCINIFNALQFQFWFVWVLLKFNHFRCFLWNWDQ